MIGFIVLDANIIKVVKGASADNFDLNILDLVSLKIRNGKVVQVSHWTSE